MEQVLGLPQLGQTTDQWCWAASGEMIMTFLGASVSQCEQANQKFDLTSCCITPTPTECVRPAWPDFAAWGFSFKKTSAGEPVSWECLRAEIEAGRPIAFSWGWPDNTGHMMVVAGFNDNGQQVLVYDPGPVGKGSSRWISYAEFVERPGHHVHWHDYYGFVPSPKPAPVPVAAAKGM
jgi:hypothetical protein